MDYQINNSLYSSTNFGGGTQIGDGAGKNSILKGNNIGDMLACTLVQGGKEPILDLNGVKIKTKATEELSQANPGDTIYLKIQAPVLLMHNGVLPLRPRSLALSDTAELALRAGVFDNPLTFLYHVRDMIGQNKLCIMDSRKLHLIGDWQQGSDGLKYSNLLFLARREYDNRIFSAGFGKTRKKKTVPEILLDCCGLTVADYDK